MRFYGIDFVAHELGIHPSSLRRWEESGLICPERATMGKTTLRIYGEEAMRLLRRAKKLMETSIRPAEAFARARNEIQQEEQHND